MNKKEIAKILEGGQEQNAASPEATSRNPRTAEDQRLRKEKAEGQMAAYGYTPRHIKACLSGELTYPDAERVNNAFDAITKPGSNLILVGPRGTGKTQIATEFGLGKMGQRYTTLSGLLQEEKDSWNRPPELDALNRPTSPLKKAKDVWLLVLDEIQEVAGTEWEMSQFVRLFDERYGSMKSTILISNLMPDAMQKFVGPSIWSRITETGMLLSCDWTSFR